MLSITSTYAIRSVLYLAQHVPWARKAGIKEISENLDIPKAFLGKVLQILARKNMISSQKGPAGGFYLTPEQMQKTIWEVVNVFDHQEIISGCVLGHPHCDSRNPCPMHQVIFKPKQQILTVFQSYTIEALSKLTQSQKLKI